MSIPSFTKCYLLTKYKSCNISSQNPNEEMNDQIQIKVKSQPDTPLPRNESCSPPLFQRLEQMMNQWWIIWYTQRLSKLWVIWNKDLRICTVASAIPCALGKELSVAFSELRLLSPLMETLNSLSSPVETVLSNS